MSLSICIAQLALATGDVPGNTQKLLAAARQAHADGAHVLLAPELALCGPAPRDLLLRPAFLAACEQALAQLAAATADLPGLVLVLGHPAPAPAAEAKGGALGAAPCLNAASVLRAGRIEQTCAKRGLSSQGVWDEPRYFRPPADAGEACVFEAEGVRLAVLVGADASHPDPLRQAAQAGARAVLVPAALPFYQGAPVEREQTLAQLAAGAGLALLCAQPVGGQDELVFDGHSLAMDGQGRTVLRAAGFREDRPVVRLGPADGTAALAAAAPVGPWMDPQEALWRALVLAVRDYVGKNRFPGVLLGLSGGMDSALVLAIAVDALGPERVRTVMMPSRYTADISRSDAQDMAQRLGVRYDVIAIGPLFDAFRAALAPQFAGLPEDTTEENLQARSRGTLLMALSNKLGHVVLTTGNKSELATGYCTLYGDMAGGFAVLMDLPKTQVYALARWRNAHDPFGVGANPIPERIITRPPSAELREDQTDQDSLPPYEVLDAVIERYMERNQSVEDIVRAGFERAVVQRVVRLIQTNEYKRHQAPVGPRLSRRAFGSDWRMPLTHPFRD